MMTIQHATKKNGFTLTELMVGLAITSIGMAAFLPSLQQQIRQTSVDSYTSKIESGIIQMKANMVSRQGSCRIQLPAGAGSETESAPLAGEQGGHSAGASAAHGPATAGSMGGWGLIWAKRHVSPYLHVPW